MPDVLREIIERADGNIGIAEVLLRQHGPVVPGREQSEPARNLEIPGLRFARPGMTFPIDAIGASW
jgi:hypothetical protein